MPWIFEQFAKLLFFHAFIFLIVPVGLSESRSDKQKEAALYLLKTAEAEANGFDGPMKASVLFALGHTYSTFDRKKSIELLTTAYSLVKGVSEDAGPDLRTLSIEIVRNVAQNAPDAVEHSLPSDPAMRDYALEEIVHHYISGRKWRAAEEYYERIETEPQIYFAAREFLEALPRSNHELTNQVFFHALRVFESQQHWAITAGREDLGSLLVRFYDRFPAQSVLDAVDELLKQAKPGNASEHSQVKNSTIAAKTAGATVTFSSFYEFRLFQLLPILQSLDPERAEKLLADAQQNTKALLGKYPNGQRSIDPGFSGQSSTTSYAIIPLNASAAPMVNQLEVQRSADEIVKRAERAPERALPQAESAPLDVRIPALLGIARIYIKRQPSISKQALTSILNATKNNSSNEGVDWRSLDEAAALFLQMGEDDSAWDACLQASKLILVIYKKDSDSDDPNQALKLFWPSVHAWRDLVQTTSKISVQRTFDILKEIPDEQIQVLEEVMVASAWMNVPVWTDVSPMVFHKDSP